MRGTFANVRLRNLLAPGTEGGVTLHLPEGTETSIFEAAMRYADEGVPLVVLAGQRVRDGEQPGLGGQGHGAARRARRASRESFERIHRSNLIGMGVAAPAVLQGRLERRAWA